MSTMADSFFFYDLETSGFSPRSARIMQFAGQRTDLELRPIGEPVNELIKLTNDILPDPDAVLLTKLTPQKTVNEGLTEAEFLQLFQQKIVKPGTIFTGFNNLRFDDEFIRFLHYRNFYDAYEWHWKNGSSRWDILDTIRMTRALKPEGIKWPFAPDGKPSNRLEYLTQVNKLFHETAHDALSDVRATIAVADLLRKKQSQLFGFLLEHRNKQAVKKIVDSGKPFMYSSGRYPSQFSHTTAAVLLGRHQDQDYALVYDLRHDPTPFLDMSVDQLVVAWQYSKDPEALRLPVKTLKYNRCPAILPGIVSDKSALERLKLSRDTIATNLKKVSRVAGSFVDKLFDAVAVMDQNRVKTQMAIVDNQLNVDERLYDAFVSGHDKPIMRAVRSARPQALTNFEEKFQDARLKNLLPLYKARNYPQALTAEERTAWEDFCTKKLFSGGSNSQLARYFARLEELTKTKVSDEQRYLLEELQLYGESIVPTEVV